MTVKLIGREPAMPKMKMEQPPRLILDGIHGIRIIFQKANARDLMQRLAYDIFLRRPKIIARRPRHDRRRVSHNRLRATPVSTFARSAKPHPKDRHQKNHHLLFDHHPQPTPPRKALSPLTPCNSSSSSRSIPSSSIPFSCKYLIYPSYSSASRSLK